MKNRIIVTILLLLSIIACVQSKKTFYELPEAMLPHVKIEYEKICDRGQKIYMQNCASCHNYKKHRKEFIPDFKPEQLTGYTLRVANKQHEVNMPDTLITEEELGIVMTFLSYKKKNK